MKDQHTALQEEHVKAENELLDLRERQQSNLRDLGVKSK